MATIDEVAQEVALELTAIRGGYEDYPDLFCYVLDIAAQAASLMSERLGNPFIRLTHVRKMFPI